MRKALKDCCVQMFRIYTGDSLLSISFWSQKARSRKIPSSRKKFKKSHSNQYLVLRQTGSSIGSAQSLSVNPTSIFPCLFSLIGILRRIPLSLQAPCPVFLSIFL